MTQEQIAELKSSLADVKSAVIGIEGVIEDLERCTSDISRKYLSAAVRKQVSAIPQMLAQTTETTVQE